MTSYGEFRLSGAAGGPSGSLFYCVFFMISNPIAYLRNLNIFKTESTQERIFFFFYGDLLSSKEKQNSAKGKCFCCILVLSLHVGGRMEGREEQRWMDGHVKERGWKEGQKVTERRGG